MDFHYGIQVRMDVQQIKPRILETEVSDGTTSTTNPAASAGNVAVNPVDNGTRFKVNGKV